MALSPTTPRADILPCASRLQRLRMVRATITDNLGTDVHLVARVLGHSMDGGKGLRALVAHISTDWCSMLREDCNKIAAAMEMIHVASLLHDDVVDDASARRHKPSANYQFGSEAAVLAGDFLYSRASQLLCDAGNIELLREISDATNQLAEGEMQQLACKGMVIDEKEYFEVIRRKTAALFSASASAGPLATQLTSMVEPLRTYGSHLGMAFQIMDDFLDYAGESSNTGKKIGTDFAEGKTTLPLLRAWKLADKKQLAQLNRAFKNRGNPDSFLAVKAVIKETEAIESVLANARASVEKAQASLARLPQGRHQEMLFRLAQTSLERVA